MAYGISPTRMAVAFARIARGCGLDVPAGSVVTFTRALAALGLERQSLVYWAGRSTFVRDPAGVPAYERAFEAFWLGRTAVAKPEIPTVPLELALDAGDSQGELEEMSITRGSTLAVRYSPLELLRHKDFAQCSPEELAECYRLMAQARVGGSLRRSRRTRPSRHGGTRPDVRRTIRYALRAGGEPIKQARLQVVDQPRRVVLVCDISGSMDPYARALLRFLHAAVVGRAKVEAFALGTRLTRVTKQLSWRDPDAALSRLADVVGDRSGGTRLGQGLAAFNHLGVARGAVVVILSDGWDRGDPDLLSAEMARLHRVAHRVVWVNPLKATPGYAPLARGMAAAIPHVDNFMEGHSLASLEALVRVIAS